MVDILVDNHSVDSLNAGQEASLILDVTPFYGEMGGQVGDTGLLQNGAGRFIVTNTVHLGDYVVHQGSLECGQFSCQDGCGSGA